MAVEACQLILGQFHNLLEPMEDSLGLIKGQFSSQYPINVPHGGVAWESSFEEAEVLFLYNLYKVFLYYLS